MTTEIFRYRISTENSKVFEQAYQKAETILRNSRHCHSLHRSLGEKPAQPRYLTPMIPTFICAGLASEADPKRFILVGRPPFRT